jgi:hypothetical protein
MKTIIFAALVIAISLVGCSVSQPGEREYYPQERVYNSPYYQSDPYYNPYSNSYSIQRIYDYNTGRYYDVKVYNNSPVYDVPVYNVPAYPNSNYRREREYYQQNQNREQYRQYQQQQQQQPNREQYRQQQQQNQSSQPTQNNQQQEVRLPDGSRVSPDGTITLPNGQVRHSK